MSNKIPIPMRIIGVLYLLVGFLFFVFGVITLIIGIPRVVPPIFERLILLGGFFLIFIGLLYIYIGKGILEGNYTAYILGFTLAVLSVADAILTGNFLNALINFIIMLIFINYEDYYRGEY